MNYQLRKNHKLFFGHNNWLLHKQIVDEFYHKHKYDFHYIEYVNANDVVNIKLEDIKEESERYPGGLKGKRYKALLKSVSEEGIKDPVLLCEVLGDSHKYTVNIGNHRVAAALITAKPLPAIVLICKEEDSMESSKQKVAFFGPWIGELGWELMTWQAWCRKKSREFDFSYACSFPDMEPLYKDFAVFIPHDHEGRALDWHKPENMEKAHFEMPDDVTDQFMPPKKYKVDGEFIQFGGGKRQGSLHPYLIHARGIGRGSKDYPIDLWEKIVSGLPPGSVASVGTLRDHHIKDTTDLRTVGLENLMYYLAEATYVIGQSSGVMHLATLCGVPIIVWGDRKTYFNETLDTRYKHTWNPFKTPVEFIFDDNWKPDPHKIVDCVSLTPQPILQPKVLDMVKDVGGETKEIPSEIGERLMTAIKADNFLISVSYLNRRKDIQVYTATHNFPKDDILLAMNEAIKQLNKDLGKMDRTITHPEQVGVKVWR